MRNDSMRTLGIEPRQLCYAEVGLFSATLGMLMLTLDRDRYLDLLSSTCTTFS